MIVDKTSADYQFNISDLHEFEAIVPMTTGERAALRKWIYSGHTLDTNPWNYTDSDGYCIGYLESYRIRYGYASLPWNREEGFNSYNQY